MPAPDAPSRAGGQRPAGGAVRTGAAAGMLLLGPGFVVGVAAAVVGLLGSSGGPDMVTLERTVFLALAAVLPPALWIALTGPERRGEGPDGPRSPGGAVVIAVTATAVGVAAAAVGFLFPAYSVPAAVGRADGYALLRALVDQLLGWRPIVVALPTLVAAGWATSRSGRR